MGMEKESFRHWEHLGEFIWARLKEVSVERRNKREEIASQELDVSGDGVYMSAERGKGYL